MPKRKDPRRAESIQPDQYAALHAQFRWLVASQFNIAHACCSRWAASPGAQHRVAVVVHNDKGAPVAHSYAELQLQANRLSNALTGLGVGRGDPVAIVLPQRFEAAVAYMAVLQMGAVA
ncbi:MAG: AMP-binding protein, partial [Betaproteobacteria bacterium]